MLTGCDIHIAISVISQSGVVACPTEYSWGISCNPYDDIAVEKIYRIKNRKKEEKKGFILISDSVDKILDIIEKKYRKLALETIEHGITYVCPDVNGQTIAIRISSNEMAKLLCSKFEYPLISTSANISNTNVSLNSKEIAKYMKEIDYIFHPEYIYSKESERKYTKIIDLVTGFIYRD